MQQQSEFGKKCDLRIIPFYSEDIISIPTISTEQHCSIPSPEPPALPCPMWFHFDPMTLEQLYRPSPHEICTYPIAQHRQRLKKSTPRLNVTPPSGHRTERLPTSTSRESKVVPQRDKPKSMIQGKNITINGGKLNNVGGNYHEHNTTYVIEESVKRFKYLEAILDTIKKLEIKINQFTSSPKEDAECDNSKQTIHELPIHPRIEIENVSDTNPSNHITGLDEPHFNSLDDPPQPTSEFDDEYCIYQTPTPTRINRFAPNSGTSSATARYAHNSLSETQQSYPFGCMPVLVPGIVHYLPFWLPSWGGWIASWTTWISPPSWLWPSFL